MAVSNVTWGAERIRGELLKLGIRVSKRTVQQYIRPVRPPGNGGQTWEVFSDGWTAQQLREATPWGHGAMHLIRDSDGTYGPKFVAVAEGAEINVVTIPPRSPNLNPICERFLKSVRHE